MGWLGGSREDEEGGLRGACEGQRALGSRRGARGGGRGPALQEPRPGKGTWAGGRQLRATRRARQGPVGLGVCAFQRIHVSLLSGPRARPASTSQTRGSTERQL